MSSARPLVIAHRGASHDEPEHTLAAYDLARSVGADGYECDVRLSGDLAPVCVHDRRLDRTSSGKGIVSELTLAELQRLDWGSWKGAPAADREVEARRRKLLTLPGFLDHVQATDRPLTTLIETKHPSRNGRHTERVLVDELHRRNLVGSGLPGRGADGHAISHPVFVMSFSVAALLRMHVLDPTIELVHLIDRVLPWSATGVLPTGVGTLGIGLDLVRERPDIVAKHRTRGHRIFVWTVDEPADVQRCLDSEVDAIITNRPSQVLDALGRG